MYDCVLCILIYFFLNFLFSVSNSTSLEFVLCPLLSGTSHLMGQSQVKALKSFEEGMVVYSALIAEPATGKSPAMNIIRKALIQIEFFLAVPSESSKLVNGT